MLSAPIRQVPVTSYYVSDGCSMRRASTLPSRHSRKCAPQVLMPNCRLSGAVNIADTLREWLSTMRLRITLVSKAFSIIPARSEQLLIAHWFWFRRERGKDSVSLPQKRRFAEFRALRRALGACPKRWKTVYQVVSSHQMTQ